MEDLVGGHLGRILCLTGGVWHILTKPLLGQEELSYGLVKHTYHIV
jgi:hypothetical protein